VRDSAANERQGEAAVHVTGVNYVPYIEKQ
jgi:hypothetical protein